MSSNKFKKSMLFGILGYFLPLLGEIVIEKLYHNTPFSYTLSEWHHHFLPILISFVSAELGYVDGKRVEKINDDAEKLRESESMFRKVTDDSTDNIILLDPSKKIIWANKKALQESGLSLDEIISHKLNCYNVTHKSDISCSALGELCPLEDIEYGIDASSYEHIHIDDLGRQVFVEVTVSSIRDNKGKIVQYIHKTRDITQKKKYEDSFENSATAMYRTTSNGEFIMANKTFRDIFGFGSFDELKKHNANELYLNLQDRIDLINELREKGHVEKTLGLKKTNGDKISVLYYMSAAFYKTGDKKGELAYLDGTIILDKKDSIIIPKCSSCDDIRIDDRWVPLLEGLHHYKVEVSHGICPTCFPKFYPEYADIIDKKL